MQLLLFILMVVCEILEMLLVSMCIKMIRLFGFIGLKCLINLLLILLVNGVLLIIVWKLWFFYEFLNNCNSLVKLRLGFCLYLIYSMFLMQLLRVGWLVGNDVVGNVVMVCQLMLSYGVKLIGCFQYLLYLIIVGLRVMLLIRVMFLLIIC